MANELSDTTSKKHTEYSDPNKDGINSLSHNIFFFLWAISMSITGMMGRYGLDSIHL